MTRLETSMAKLSTMVNDIGSFAVFHRGSFAVFHRGGPLDWFALTKTYAVAAKKGFLSDKQCDLIDKVHDQYVHIRQASQRFLCLDMSRVMASAMQQVQKAKPQTVSSEDRRRNNRLARIVHALLRPGLVHIGIFDEAERVVGELCIPDKQEIWKVIHTARHAYLGEMYGCAGDSITMQTPHGLDRSSAGGRGPPLTAQVHIPDVIFTRDQEWAPMTDPKSSNPIPSLAPVIERWRQMIHSFSKAVSNDAAYWCSERANCGVLSAAAWLEGGHSVVSYREDKIWKGESYPGRVDLWMQTKDKVSFIVEAKHDWTWTFRSVHQLRDRLSGKLNWACEDAEVVPATSDDRRLGILFAVPGPRTDDQQRAMDLFHEAHRGLSDLDIHEWVEPSDAPHWEKRTYPGVLLLGRLVSGGESE